METGARPRHPAIAQPGGARMAFAQATIAQLADAERAAVPPSFWAQAADLPVFAQSNSEEKQTVPLSVPAKFIKCCTIVVDPEPDPKLFARSGSDKFKFFVNEIC